LKDILHYYLYILEFFWDILGNKKKLLTLHNALSGSQPHNQ
jgi:hypothetical protein